MITAQVWGVQPVNGRKFPCVASPLANFVIVIIIIYTLLFFFFNDLLSAPRLPKFSAGGRGKSVRQSIPESRLFRAHRRSLQCVRRKFPEPMPTITAENCRGNCVYTVRRIDFPALSPVGAGEQERPREPIPLLF